MTVPQQVLDVLHSGDVYLWDGELMDVAQQEQRDILRRTNELPAVDPERERLLRTYFAEMGENTWVEPPLHANWGCSTHLGNQVYANFNLTLVDDGEIFIGDHTMIGPNVTLVTTGHPIRPDLRERLAQFSEPIHIGRNVWIGANVTVLPGVTIGDNAVIGACSLVTKDIPANSVAVGSPCRVMREINEHDNEYYWRDRRIPVDL
ncbi:galactoside O-acetyltransferase [Bifidobacterium callitrichidarum]|uniref:Acetyltransferase n=2 Tax=Bifidobacterium callitrichidarum TaxID=2052941 RepID=A0A2U2N6E1_9BIFI|nr:sugar O-acetyltransferase [Bifidobacterium callitrichidarum]PWG64746.1 galactoside O-acetyltransferase [Bifidobacterium callitrichidarum]